MRNAPELVAAVCTLAIAAAYVRAGLPAALGVAILSIVMGPLAVGVTHDV